MIVHLPDNLLLVLSIIKINYSPQICRIEAKKVILQMKDAIRQRAARFPNVK